MFGQAYQLTKEQESDYKKAFDLVDKNKDGIISTSELGAAMKAAGLTLSELELTKIIDAEKNEMRFKEFVGLMIRIVNKSKIDEIREYFREFDADSDGNITAAEAQMYFEKEGLPKEEIETYVEKMFHSMDANKDRNITVEGMSESNSAIIVIIIIIVSSNLQSSFSIICLHLLTHEHCTLNL